MNQSYISGQYPGGKVRIARAAHICNGSLNGKDPGCGGQISIGEPFFDTGERGPTYRAGRFCRHCAAIESGCQDLFDMIDSRQSGVNSISKGGYDD